MENISQVSGPYLTPGDTTMTDALSPLWKILPTDELCSKCQDVLNNIPENLEDWVLPYPNIAIRPCLHYDHVDAIIGESKRTRCAICIHFVETLTPHTISQARSAPNFYYAVSLIHGVESEAKLSRGPMTPIYGIRLQIGTGRLSADRELFSEYEVYAHQDFYSRPLKFDNRSESSLCSE